MGNTGVFLLHRLGGKSFTEQERAKNKEKDKELEKLKE